jgi:predicted cupin superfamily sugar epimerase
MLTADQIRQILKMQPLPVEGGYFAETYRSPLTLPRQALPSGYPADRAMATAIYYLLTPDTFSAVHKLRGDETYHFYLGDPVEMLQLNPDGTGGAILLGQDIAAGMRLQHTVPGGAWQGSRLAPGGKFALLGTTMAPGFDPQDYEPGNRETLSALYPKYAALIALLTR